MYILFLLIHILVCVFLIIVVLLQSGKAADLAGAFGGMGSQTAFGPRGSATFLSRRLPISDGSVHGHFAFALPSCDAVRRPGNYGSGGRFTKSVRSGAGAGHPTSGISRAGSGGAAIADHPNPDPDQAERREARSHCESRLSRRRIRNSHATRRWRNWQTQLEV